MRPSRDLLANAVVRRYVRLLAPHAGASQATPRRRKSLASKEYTVRFFGWACAARRQSTKSTGVDPKRARALTRTPFLATSTPRKLRIAASRSAISERGTP